MKNTDATELWAELLAIQVVKVLRHNADAARALVHQAVPALGRPRALCPAGCDRALEHALITAPDQRDPALLAKLDVIAGRVVR